MHVEQVMMEFGLISITPRRKSPILYEAERSAVSD